MNLEGLEDQRERARAEKEAEARLEHGDNVLLKLKLPDGAVTEHRLPAGVTVQYVKLVVEQSHNIPVAQQTLLLNGKKLIDPFSLCDYPEMQPGKECEVVVQAAA